MATKLSGGGSAFGGSPSYGGKPASGSGSKNDPYRKSSSSNKKQNTTVRQDIAQQGSPAFQALANEQLSASEKRSVPRSGVGVIDKQAQNNPSREALINRAQSQVTVYAAQTQQQSTTPAMQPTATPERTAEQQAVIQRGEELRARQESARLRQNRARDLYRTIPFLAGNNAVQRGTREALFLLNPGTSAPAFGETIAGAVDASRYLIAYRAAYGTQSAPTNNALFLETARQAARVATARNPQTGAFTPESIGSTAALYIGAGIGIASIKGAAVPDTVPKPSNTGIRHISIFEEAGVPRATGDLPPSINYADVAPRGVALSPEQARTGVPLEYTFEKINGRVQAQTRLGQGSDPISTTARQLTTEQFGTLTERYVFDTAGRSPQQTQLTAVSERGVRTESGALINRIPTSEQVRAAGNIKIESATARQTVLDTFTGRELTIYKAPRTEPLTVQKITSLLKNRRAELITRKPSSYTNPNKLPGEMPSKGLLRSVTNNPFTTPRPEAPSSGFIPPGTLYIGKQTSAPAQTSITESRAAQSINYDKPTLPQQKQFSALKPIASPIQELTPATIVKPRQRTRQSNGQRIEQIQTPIQQTEDTPAYKPPKPKIPTTPRINTITQTTDKFTLPPPIPRIKSQTSRQDTQEGFNVLVRRRGVFQRVNTQPLSKIQAINFGAFNVGTSAAASFKLTPANSGATGTFTGRGVLSNFTKNKTGLYIEKPGKRIKSIGELQQITFKGIAANKTKKSKKFNALNLKPSNSFISKLKKVKL